jgi:uncharacterized protein
MHQDGGGSATLGVPNRPTPIRESLEMEWFVYGRDRPGAGTLREELAEAHWSFMDGYAGAMIARGPTLTADRTAATGSMHIVDLPDATAAREFAFEEPYYRAGVFADVLVRRWRNVLGGTMWDFEGDAAANRRFLVLGHGKPGMSAARDTLVSEHRRYFVDQGYLDCFIERGPLLDDDGAEWVGSAMLVELPDRAAVEAMLAREPYVNAGLYADLEIHDWQFGGRPA